METLAIIVCGSVLTAIAVDLLRGRVLRKRIVSLSAQFQSTLALADKTSAGLEELADQIERDALLAQNTSPEAPKREMDDFPDLSAVLYDKPYFRVSVESGRQLVVAVADAYGNVSIRETSKRPEIFLSKEVDYEQASTLLSAALENYKELGPKDDIQVRRERVPRTSSRKSLPVGT